MICFMQRFMQCSMQRIAILGIAGVFLTVMIAGAIDCAALVCKEVAFRPRAEVPSGDLRLADLLAPGACPLLRAEAAKIRFGAAPRAGAVRVLDGNTIRGVMRELRNEVAAPEEAHWRIPERVEIRLAGARQACAKIAQFIESLETFAPAGLEGSNWRDALNCAAAHEIPESSSLELARTSWNASLQRWEFALRCTRTNECVPFTVWANVKPPAEEVLRNSASYSQTLEHRRASAGIAGLIRPGETATLTWDHAGIRLVLPVTCLDAGQVGQSIRVRVRNGNRTLRAQVVDARNVRVGL
jgi:hypothetical protein